MSNSGAYGLPHPRTKLFPKVVTLTFTGTTTVNDLETQGADVLYVDPGSILTLNGIAGGVDGRILIIENTTSSAFVVNDRNNTSAYAPGNGISFGGSETVVTVKQYERLVLRYDGVRAAWLALVPNAGSSLTALDTTAGSSSAPGGSGGFARDDHRHGFTQRTRYIAIPAQDMTNDDGTTTSSGASPDLIAARVMADAVATGSYFTFVVPEDWVSATALTAVIFWSTPTTVATSAVRWRLQRLELITGTTDVTGAMTLTEFTGTSQTHTNGILYSDSSAWFTPTTAGNVIKAGIRRVGGDAADTLTANARMHALRIEYTAQA